MSGRRYLIFRDGTQVTNGMYAKGHMTYAEIRQKDRLYMRRWYILVFPNLFSVRVHHICLPDHDEWPHDHPWSFLSIILRGGYREWWCTRPGFKWYIPDGLPEGSHWGAKWDMFKHKNVRFLNYHRAEDLHQIRAFHREGRGAWTLILTGPERREWGFMTNWGWTDRRAMNLGASTGPEPD